MAIKQYLSILAYAFSYRTRLYWFLNFPFNLFMVRKKVARTMKNIMTLDSEVSHVNVYQCKIIDNEIVHIAEQFQMKEIGIKSKYTNYLL